MSTPQTHISKIELLKELFLIFIKVGSFMFGGGYVMLPLLSRELVEKKQWMSDEEVLEIFSISQMTPGTIAINIATFIGHKKASIAGAIVSTVGLIIPSLVCVTVIYYFFNSAFDNIYVQKAFMGIRACLIAMILVAVYKLFKTGIKGHLPFFLFLLAITALILGIQPVVIILAGLVLGLVIWWLLPLIKNKRT